MPRSALVIDDDADFRALAVRTLRRWGYGPVDEAGTVSDALRMTAEACSNVIIVDVCLPDGDGVTLAGQLAALPSRPVVVLISSDPDITDDAAARQRGAAGFFAKEDFPGIRMQRLIAAP